MTRQLCTLMYSGQNEGKSLIPEVYKNIKG